MPQLKSGSNTAPRNVAKTQGDHCICNGCFGFVYVFNFVRSAGFCDWFCSGRYGAGSSYGADEFADHGVGTYLYFVWSVDGNAYLALRLE